jgi:hypothetical protein
MTNPKYLVNIYYSNPVRTGSTGETQSGVWQTYPVTTGGWFVATMPEVNISATGSTYAGALTALLTVANNTPDAAQGPFKN